MASPTPVVGVPDIEGLVVEIAIHPAECAQFASTCSEPCVQEHEKLIPELELGQNQATCSAVNLNGDLWRLALTRTPVLGPRFPPLRHFSGRYQALLQCPRSCAAWDSI